MKVFDFVCEELSLAMDQPIIGKVRYDLWTSMALQDAHPAFDLTGEKAATYLETGTGNLVQRCRETIGPKVWARLVKRVRNFNPNADRPEAVFRRLSGEGGEER